MSPRIFVTGASGYVGGTTVKHLIQKHPEYHVVALVRDESQAGKLKAVWPKIETIVGTLDDTEVLSKESAKADVVLQLASSDHVGAVKAIISGLGTGTRGHLLHVSGTGVLNDASTGFGNAAPKVYDDIKDVKEITSLPSSALHRDVDDAVITSGKEHNVPTAILCPPLIYGVGEGPAKKRSIQIPFLSEAILKRGRAFTVGQGNNIWDKAYVGDVANAFIFLTEQALAKNSAATWGEEGYYFVENGQFAWKDISAQIAKIAHAQGAISSTEIDALLVDEAVKFHPWAPVLWGGNCRSRASRLRQLGWKPSGPSLEEALPAMVNAELVSLGTQTSKTTFSS